MKIEQVDPCAVSIPRRLRAPDPAKTKQIGESMAAIGLQQPIAVWTPKDGDCELIAGAHRLQAAVDLGWDWIDVVFHDDWSEIDRQLWEIDENLMRAELNPTELGEHVTRREKLWTKRSEMGERSSPTHDATGRKKTPQQSKGFAADTAEATGMSKRTINEHLSRAKAIPEDVRAQIKGTKLDTGVYLDSLKGMEPEEQRAKVTADLIEPEKPKLPSPKEAREVARATNRMVAASDGNLYSGATDEEGAEHVRLRTQTYSVIDAINTIAEIGITPKQWCEETKEHWLNRFEFGRIIFAVVWLTKLRAEFTRQNLMFDCEVDGDLAEPAKPKPTVPTDGVEREFEALKWQWGQKSHEVQRRFKAWVLEQETPVSDDETDYDRVES